MAAGKSSMAAMLAKFMLETLCVDHVLVLVPWLSVQGDAEKGMLGAFGRNLGLDARSRFFTLLRRQAQQPKPENQATVTLYQEACCQQALDVINLWKSQDGFRFGLICDEIHHAQEMSGMWGTYVGMLRELADYAVFMSGTLFRRDHNPIACIPLGDEKKPVRHFYYGYQEAIGDFVVRPVTVRRFDAKVSLYDRRTDNAYATYLSEIDPKTRKGQEELKAAKRQVLAADGECIREIIERVQEDLTNRRKKFSDAACLFVCRPGVGDEFGLLGDKAEEDRHVFSIAKQIRQLTGEDPVVVTHRDKDAQGKISRFRKSTDRYLVAINMVSEGCDIPRLRSVAFCRYTESELLFRQVVGRALRMQSDPITGALHEDEAAAQVYIPVFPDMDVFGSRLREEADAGVRDRPRCETCGKWPCECLKGPETICTWPGSDNKDDGLPKVYDPDVVCLEAVPVVDGGYVATFRVEERFVQVAKSLHANNPDLTLSNSVQLGAMLQLYDMASRGGGQATAEKPVNPVEERDQLAQKAKKLVNTITFRRCHPNKPTEEDYAQTWTKEVESIFGERWSVIRNAGTVERMREIVQRLEQRHEKVLRRKNRPGA